MVINIFLEVFQKSEILKNAVSERKLVYEQQFVFPCRKMSHVRIWA